MSPISMVSVVAGFSCASIDVNVAHWFRARLTPVSADVLFGITELGCPAWISFLVIAAAACLAWKRHWYRVFALLLTVPGGALLCEVLKLVIQRPRPFVAGPFGVWGGYSFPSGHTIAATLVYGFMAAQLLPLWNRRRWQWLSLVTAGLLIVLVGFSRVALGAHYLTDVLAAMFIGITWVLLCSTYLASIRPKPQLEMEEIDSKGKL